MSFDHEKAAQLKTIGGNVRRERVRRKMTQEHLAEMAELHLRTIQKIEAGQLDVLVMTIIRIKRALRCPWTRVLD